MPSGSCKMNSENTTQSALWGFAGGRAILERNPGIQNEIKSLKVSNERNSSEAKNADEFNAKEEAIGDLVTIPAFLISLHNCATISAQ